MSEDLRARHYQAEQLSRRADCIPVVAQPRGGGHLARLCCNPASRLLGLPTWSS